MKQNLLIFLSLLGIMSFFISCKKDHSLNSLQVTEVKNLYAPSENKFIKMTSPNSTLTFEWEQAKAEDGGMVLYEVLFDREAGDFSNPVYVMPSDNNGMYNVLTLKHADLNRIASLAGIEPEAVGKIKWTVASSKGVNQKIAAVSRVFDVQRLPGFTDLPPELYLYGSATEAGDNIAKAIPFKQTADGKFEIFTSLKNGEYKLVDRTTGTPVSYAIEGNKIIKSNNAASVSGGNNAFRITLDFTNASATVQTVQSIGLWFPPFGRFLTEIPYAGNGIWKKENVSIIFKQESWGRDERYKFRMKLGDLAGNESDLWFGSSNRDNQRPNSGTPASYWYLYEVSNHDWDNSFKFDGNADMKNVDVILDFRAAIPQYTHSIIVK